MTTPQPQCTNLELSKKLRELGYPQESLFKWHSKIDEDGKPCHTELTYFPGECINQDVSAPTVAELGMALPVHFYDEHYLYCEKLEDGWLVSYKSENGTYIWSPGLKKAEVVSENEADARAKMLIYLLENKLIEL